MHRIYLFPSLKCLPHFVIAPVFITLPQSLTLTLLLFLAPSICDFAVKAFCCGGVCGGFWSISWIYSSKSKAFFTSVSLLSTNVCLRENVCVRVYVHVTLCVQGFHFSLEAEGHDAS